MEKSGTEERGCLPWMCLLALGNGAIAEGMGVTPEGFVCRELSHPTSTLPSHRDGHPQTPKGMLRHLAETRLGQVPPAKPQFPQL